ncbi:class I SAM-dependent methyltransferase [Prosthecobacter vanneervenii]|uniref:Ubiquinone/menaquinone biosynthesis C-methylase UbiE n=1 Tax=Prosthecobacter vanneervenii TaxID=48466 RepID=A0A7W7YBX6_9BACT|nr:class I SAM-dependent methyltransferase [Prosthecobacter vanneervenii]MBB5033361.1 ubiquinone/menaquinone biosynthesis C-methylase UbiE [Prosthecobacter vanneervenii]
MPAASSAPEQRFSDRVENYVRYRPGYPQEIIPLLQREAGLTPQSVIADIGSGTGISAELFLKAGFSVHAVEPNGDMRAAAERLLAPFPNFHSVNASAQATTLPDHSIDLIVAAQAFHWFNSPETRSEFNRILKPGGHIALIWNERKLDSTPFLRVFEQLLLTFGTDYTAIRHENVNAAALASFFSGPYATHTFANEQRFDFEGLKGRLLSSSYAPAEGQPRHEEMIAELRRIFDAHQVAGQVCFEYDTRVHLGH